MKENNRQKYLPCILLTDFHEATFQATIKKYAFKQVTENFLKQFLIRQAILKWFFFFKNLSTAYNILSVKVLASSCISIRAVWKFKLSTIWFLKACIVYYKYFEQCSDSCTYQALSNLGY